MKSINKKYSNNKKQMNKCNTQNIIKELVIKKKKKLKLQE